MAIGPALPALIGTSARWLPSWLGSVPANVDIEGGNLRRQLTTGEGDDGVDHLVNAPA